MIFQIKLATLLLLVVPIMLGASIPPQMISAFAMGAWAGLILLGPPIMLFAFLLGLVSLRQLLAPLVRLPVLIALTVVVLYLSGAELTYGLQGAALGGDALVGQ